MKLLNKWIKNLKPECPRCHVIFNYMFLMVVAYFLLGGFIIGKYYEHKSTQIIQEKIDQVEAWAISNYPDMPNSELNNIFGNKTYSINLSINRT